MKVACMLDAGTYKPGDPPPAGYVQWHEWAETQHKAGLRQKQCGRCGLWRFPQEMSGVTISHTAQSRKGPVTITAPLCKQCNPDGVAVAAPGCICDPTAARFREDCPRHAGNAKWWKERDEREAAIGVAPTHSTQPEQPR